MITKFISLDKVNDIIEFVRHASMVDGDVLVRKGVYTADGKSIMGIISLYPSNGITVEYPEDATDFAKYLEETF